jgi:hypothetical protein
MTDTGPILFQAAFSRTAPSKMRRLLEAGGHGPRLLARLRELRHSRRGIGLHGTIEFALGDIRDSDGSDLLIFGKPGRLRYRSLRNGGGASTVSIWPSTFWSSLELGCDRAGAALPPAKRMPFKAKRLFLLVPGEGFEPPTCGLQKRRPALAGQNDR